MPSDRDYLALKGELEWAKRNLAYWRSHAEKLEDTIRDLLDREAKRGIDE